MFVINGATGTGKSAIAKILIDSCGGHVITPTNVLLEQYSRQYKSIGVLKGFNTYECSESEDMSCGERRAVCKRFCSGCPALKAAVKARSGVPVFANPISYRALQFSKAWQPPNVLVVDEAHKLKSMALLMYEGKLRAEEFALPKLTNQVDLVAWMDRKLGTLRATLDANINKAEQPNVRAAAKQWAKLYKLREGLNNPENIIMEWRTEYWRGKKKDFLYLTPVQPPLELFDRLLRAKKLVLMSATIFPSDVKELIGDRPFKYLDVPSPIPARQRPILLRPMRSANWQTPVSEIAAWIEEQLKLHKGNAIVHVTYALASKLKPFSFYTVANFKPEDKAKAIKKFKAEGGVFLAAGCAEGLDLPHDECRVNLIPILAKENIGDAAVKKRLAMPGGQKKYELEIIRTTIQQAGRSTRDITDHSVVVVGDNYMAGLVRKHKREIPTSFTEAIDGN